MRPDATYTCTLPLCSRSSRLLGGFGLELLHRFAHGPQHLFTSAVEHGGIIITERHLAKLDNPIPHESDSIIEFGQV